MRKNGNKEERNWKRKTKDEVKSNLIRSFLENNVFENEECAQRAVNQTIIRSKKEGILNAAFNQGKVFKIFKSQAGLWR